MNVTSVDPNTWPCWEKLTPHYLHAVVFTVFFHERWCCRCSLPGGSRGEQRARLQHGITCRFQHIGVHISDGSYRMPCHCANNNTSVMFLICKGTLFRNYIPCFASVSKHFQAVSRLSSSLVQSDSFRIQTFSHIIFHNCSKQITSLAKE